MSVSEKENGRAGTNGAPESEELGMGSFDGIGDSIATLTKAPSFRPDCLDAYAEAGFELIPLHAPNALDAEGRSIGKVPMKDWRINAALSPDDAKAHMASGCNVGVRLRPTELVVDVDPRNFADGDDPLARLGVDLGIDWADFPTVVTGSGGKHIYMSKPDGELLRNEVPGYAGIEFKSHGRQVVAAGSVHPDTGKPYLWDDDPLALPLRSLPPAPANLIELARRPAPMSNAAPGGERSPEQLEAMLAGLNPIDFAEYDRWLRLMMACHHATGGAGREEFIAWSIGDARYAGHADSIGRKWDALRYNIWRNSGVTAKPGDVQSFLDHMAYLFEDEGERGYVLDYLAMLVQRPDQKVNYALLVKGAQGTGKSWIGRLMTRIIGERNVTLPSNGEVMSQWTVWTEGAQLAIIEELMAVGRLDMANRLKPIITEPTLRIESKGCSLYSIPNKLNLMAFTNHDDAVPLERGDRRWLVVFSKVEPREEAYFERLFAFLDGEGPAAVKDWLLRRQVTLNPKGMAPKTTGKDEMRRLSMGEPEQFLSERLEDGGAPFDFPLVRFEDVLDTVPLDIARRSRGLRNQVTKWLTGEAGAVKHSRYKKQDGSNRQNCHLWSIRDHDHWRDMGAAARIDAYHAHWNQPGRFEE